VFQDCDNLVLLALLNCFCYSAQILYAGFAGSEVRQVDCNSRIVFSMTIPS